MPDQPAEIGGKLNLRRERKERLVLACAADRAAWRHACLAPARSSRLRLLRDVLAYCEPFSGVVPGRLGRWLRGVGGIAQLVRRLGWF